jgi:hypothetical protein
MQQKTSRSKLVGCGLILALLAGCEYVPEWAQIGGSDEEPKLEGSRQSVVPGVPGIQADAATTAAPFTLPPMTANADWAQHSGEFTFHTGHLALTGNLDTQRRADMGDGAAFAHTLVPRPVVAATRHRTNSRSLLASMACA